MSVQLPDRTDAFADFVEANSLRLGRLCWALAGDRPRGQDLAQATLERLWPRWDRVASSGDPWAYTCKIAISIQSSWRRRKSCRAETLAPAVPDAVSSDMTDRVLDGIKIREWMKTLPPRQRAVIALRFLMDMTVEETAASLSCSSGTVKSQTARALDRLRGLAWDEEGK